MSLSIEIQKKPSSIMYKNISKPSAVIEIEEVREIKDAIQEHLLFLGLDKGNNVINITLLGLGTSDKITINNRDILRTALVTASDKVILVHNHPSNSLRPSIQDRELTNEISKLLKVLNIELLDHIIVTEKSFVSMKELNVFDKDYENKRTQIIDNVLLIEENKELKEKIKILDNRLKKYKKQNIEEEFE